LYLDVVEHLIESLKRCSFVNAAFERAEAV
jgi:hypothetical protein